MNRKAELTALVKELEALDIEYEFARGRAAVHKPKALTGDILSMMAYSGSVQRMQEIEKRALVIEDRIAALELILR